MRKSILIATFVGAGLVLAGCKKNKGNIIEVDSPKENTEYTSPVPLMVHIENEDEPVHDIEIKVYKKDDPTVLVFDYDNHLEDHHVHVEDSIFANVSSATQFTLDIKTGEDVVTTLKHDFSIKP
ncbi:MAG: hypothetical protein ACT6QS_16015 [Flavobacteriales bacterium]